MAVAHDTGRVRSGDVEIFYRRLGRRGKTPLLIVHGLSFFSWDWLPVAHMLGAEREVVAMDMRGFGDSTWSPSQDYSVARMGEDVVALLDHLGWPKAVLIGHSMGGRSVAWVAARHASRAAALVLVDYSPENAPAGSKRVTQRVAQTPDKFGSPEEAMRYFNQSYAERFSHYLKPVEGGFVVKRDPYFRDQFRRVLETGERPKLGIDMWEIVKAVRCPILSLRGERSDMYAPETAQKMKAANARLAVVEVDAGHNVAGDNPDAFVAAVRRFLEPLEEKRHETVR